MSFLSYSGQCSVDERIDGSCSLVQKGTCNTAL